MTAQQPVNNIIRGTSQAIALVLAGVQAVEISAFAEAFRTPSPGSHLVGLRTQQILDLEAGVARVADPFGASYFIEHVTDEIEGRIVARVKEIEALGDAAELVNQGFFRQIFTSAMERQQKDVAKGDLPVVGVNCHQVPEEDDRLLKAIAEQKIESFQEYVEKIWTWKAGRDKSAVRAAIDRYKTVVENGENLVPATRDCLNHDLTFGEIKGAARDVMGLPYDFYGMVSAPA